MGIKWKLLLMVGLPVSAMIIIFAVGLSSFYIIESTMDEVNMLHMDRATMIDADRDAYQAQMSAIDSLKARSKDALNKAKESSDENLQQTWDRIVGPSKNFTPEMNQIFASFKDSFSQWKIKNNDVIDLSFQTLEANLQRDDAEKAALSSFESMREVINNLGEMIEKELQNPDLDMTTRLKLEAALSSVLNADRDAYQAYVAQLLITRLTSIESVNKAAESFEENVGQTRERVLKGVDLVGGRAMELKRGFEPLFDSWVTQSEKVVKITRADIDKNLAKVASLAEGEKSFAAMRDSINNLGELETTQVEFYIQGLSDTVNRTIMIYMAVTILFLVAAIAITLLVSSRISDAMKKTARIAESLSEGDFSVHLDVDRSDEIGQLAMAMTRMIDKLRGIVVEVQSAAGNVSTGSAQLASSSQSLSQGATEQASAVEEVSSAMEEMSSSISQNSSSSGKTEALARRTAEEGRQGGEAVKHTVAAMKQIAEKISIIEEIARQTNLLALNAAIEAARAGEQGKGFAVVAAEVRKLAERSGTAAAEIGELSASSVEVATKAGQMLDSIVPNIEQTAELVQEITAASTEQNTGANEINSALQQLDKVIQSNAGSSEEIASTAEELSSQASQLESLMAFFQLGQASEKRDRQAMARKAPLKLEQSPSKGLELEMDDDSSFERF
jgi:Methyl-accepting chemotaxis protein